jgi:hypothetical protein
MQEISSLEDVFLKTAYNSLTGQTHGKLSSIISLGPLQRGQPRPIG